MAVTGQGGAEPSRSTVVLFWGAVALVLLWCFPYHAWLQHANELPRMFMTMALVEEGRFGIDTYQRHFGYRKAMDISRSVCLGPRVVRSVSIRLREPGGAVRTMAPRFEDPRRPPCQERHFSNKAPGQSLLAVPGYAIQRALYKARGAPPDVRQVASPEVRQERLRQAIHLGRLTTATVPAFLFLLLLSWWLRPWVPDPHIRHVAVAAYGLGTLAFTYSVQLMSHQLGTLFLFSGFIVINAVAHGRLGTSGPRAVAWLLLAGLSAGSSLACDYQLVFAAAALAVYGLAVLRPFPRVLLVALGTLPPLAVLLVYHHAAFGAIHWTGYEFLIDRTDQALHTKGLLGMTHPRGEALWGSFFRPDNGLFYFSPWLMVSLLGLGALWRLGRPRTGAEPSSTCRWGAQGAASTSRLRRLLQALRPSPEAAFLLAVMVVYTYFIGSISFWRGGWQTGPRYVAAMLPCFVLPYALLLQRVRAQPLAWAAALAPALFSIGVYALVVTGFPHFPDKFKYPLFDLVGPLLADDYVSYTLGGWVLGHSREGALLPYLTLLLLVGGYLALGSPRRSASRVSWGGARLVSAVLAFSLAALMAHGYGRLAARGIERARPLPVKGHRGERYGAFLQRAQGDIRRHWEPPLAFPEIRRWPGGTSRAGRKVHRSHSRPGGR